MGTSHESHLIQPSESSDKMRSDWVKRVAKADWLTADERETLMNIKDDNIIQEVSGKDVFRFITTFSRMPEGFSADRMKKTLTGEFEYIYAIIKLLAGPIEETRSRINNVTRWTHPHPGWEHSE